VCNCRVVEEVLNHRSGRFSGIVGVYQHYDFAGEKRAALDLWARHVERIVAGSVDDNVIPFATSGN
jgi:hypothetical protein